MIQSKNLGLDPAPESLKVAEGSSFERQNQRTELEAARVRTIKNRLSQMPKSAQRAYLRATRGKASPLAAIKAQCLECIGWERAEIAQCTGFACPLWMYRPWKAEGKKRQAAATVERKPENKKIGNENGVSNYA